MKKRFLLLTVILILSLTVLTACSSNKQNGNATNQNPTTQGTTEQNNNGTANNQGTAAPNNNTNSQNAANNNAADNTYNESRSKALSDAIRAEISQAQDVWVMVVGNSAYVALDIAAQDTSGEAKSLKEQVADVVIKADEGITDVYVTEDADSFTRVKDTFGDLVNGHPVSGLTEEITNLFTRITPTRASK